MMWNMCLRIYPHSSQTVQISQAFYSIMYYDTYQRTIEHILILLAMAAVLFAASALFIRRQRYASL